MSTPLPAPVIPGANPRLGGAYMTDGPGGLALVGQRCDRCGHMQFPKAGVCSACRSSDVSDCELPREGTLYSWAVVHVAPKPWKTPYVIGYVDLPNGVRVFSHIGGDPGALRIDMRVRVEPAEVGVDAEGRPRPFFMFTPARTEVA